MKPKYTLMAFIALICMSAVQADNNDRQTQNRDLTIQAPGHNQGVATQPALPALPPNTGGCGPDPTQGVPGALTEEEIEYLEDANKTLRAALEVFGATPAASTLTLYRQIDLNTLALAKAISRQCAGGACEQTQ